MSRSIWLRGIGTTFVDIFRGTPLLVQAFFIYFGIPSALGFQMSALTAGIITLSLNAGAYMTEIVRGGIQSVDKGQMEASRSLGIGYLPTMRKVILPQAIRTMIPSYINQFVITLKDTSILSVIGIAELTQTGRIIIAGNYESFKMWLIIGIIYFIVIMALTKLSDRLEKEDGEMSELVPEAAAAEPAGHRQDPYRGPEEVVRRAGGAQRHRHRPSATARWSASSGRPARASRRSCAA